MRKSELETWTSGSERRVYDVSRFTRESSAKVDSRWSFGNFSSLTSVNILMGIFKFEVISKSLENKDLKKTSAIQNESGDKRSKH